MSSAPRPAARAATFAALVGLGLGAIATGCTDDGGSKEAFCKEVATMPSLETVLTRFSETDPEELQDRIDQTRSAYEALHDAAPGEIRGETGDVVSLVDAVLDAVEDHPDDPEAASDQLRKAMADHEGVEESRAALARYASEECGIALDPETEVPETVTSTTAEVTTTTTA